MMEWFDMGKYDFYVWTSIGVFAVAMLADYVSVRNRAKHIKRQIKAKNRRKQS
ncbi:heme exporter protein CcmD [Marinicella sediminis]|uniref:Heme exporter protein D n=1 Tax=Marinicella sediminis TaxID=1792834 RepID=A0ABV7JCV0_9GAMM|nr:heme exporter protein CcmD [Marinicella sediminis]